MEYYSKCLRIREKVLENDDLDLAIAYYCIGNCLFNLRKYEDSMEFHLKCL